MRNSGAAGQHVIAEGGLPVPGDDELSTIKKLGSGQEGPSQIGAIEYRFEEVRALQMGTRQIRVAEVCSPQIGTPKIGLRKIEPAQIEASQTGLR